MPEWKQGYYNMGRLFQKKQEEDDDEDEEEEEEEEEEEKKFIVKYFANERELIASGRP
jgi:hypothetical protein